MTRLPGRTFRSARGARPQRGCGAPNPSTQQSPFKSANPIVNAAGVER